MERIKEIHDISTNWKYDKKYKFKVDIYPTTNKELALSFVDDTAVEVKEDNNDT